MLQVISQEQVRPFHRMPENPKMDKRWFKARLDEKGMSGAALARALGVDRSAVSLMLSGKRRMTVSEAGEIAEIFGVPVAEILARAGVQVASGRTWVPIIGLIGARARVNMQKTQERVDAPADLPDGTLAIRDEDPASRSFGWVYFYVNQRALSPDVIGALCVVELRDGSYVLGNLSRGLARGRFDLKPFDATRPADTTITNADVVAASPILWIKNI